MSHSHAHADLALAPDNVYLSDNAGRSLWMGLGAVGLGLVAVTVLGGITGDAKTASIALHAYHTAAMYVMGIPLGAMGVVMILHQVNAGWSATLRRQFENVMRLMPVGIAAIIGSFVLQAVFVRVFPAGEKAPYLWNWMNPAYIDGDPLYAAKWPYLTLWRFYGCALLYFAIWMGLSSALWNYSTRQDADGDRWHTARARKLSAVGLPLFAFTTAFAAFDWVMTLDFHWFSTMFGVWYFAGNMVGCLATTLLVLVLLRSFGRLHVCFTDEHLHDMSKLLFGFTVFWAYISFSQYFLIWYAMIPEETLFFIVRREGVWNYLAWGVPIGHFIVPFILLLPRPWRRKRGVVGLMCVWLLAMHALDYFWFIRPEVKGSGLHWLDAVGVVGPILVLAGALVRQVASGPLVPLKDPRLGEALGHTNTI
ncbi:MAG: hypothetical protein IBJ11_04560 [Phycisphaerales bacterium]|nr:hypothetical protein [Phycisphaerales bacterium]